VGVGMACCLHSFLSLGVGQAFGPCLVVELHTSPLTGPLTQAVGAPSAAVWGAIGARGCRVVSCLSVLRDAAGIDSSGAPPYGHRLVRGGRVPDSRWAAAPWSPRGRTRGGLMRKAALHV